MKIKELEITEEMYLEAKKVEDLYHLKDKFEVRSEEFRKHNNEWVKADEEFQKNFCDEFDTLEIVNEYERREKKMIKWLKDMTENDYGVIKYGVLVNDDYFEFVTDRRLHTEEIASFLECEIEEIGQIDFEDYE